MVFLIHTFKGWINVYMFTNPISVTFLRLPTKFYSSKYESNEMTDPTKTSSTPMKTQTMLQSLYVLPNTYFQRMDSSPYLYQPNISLVLAITYYILYFHEIWIHEITVPTKSNSTATKTQTMLQNSYVLPKTYCWWMDSSPYLYQPNISLVLAITYYII